MCLWKEAFEEWSPSGCKFKKFHMFLHYYDFILEYGAPTLTYGGWWEKAHIFLVKVPYLRTGRRVASLIKMLMLRVALAETVKRKKHIVLSRAPEDEKVWVTKRINGKKRKVVVSKASLAEKEDEYIADGNDVQAGVREHDGYLRFNQG